MKTLLTILLLAFVVSATAQDTVRYLGGAPQYDYHKLSSKIDGMQYNIGIYASQRRVAYLYMGASVLSFSAVTGYNVSSAPEDVAPGLFIIPSALGIISAFKFIKAEKYLRKAGIEVTPSGVRITF
jgi:hypothetical protein